ncbi:DNA polymerase III sliding clamp (beta) subunit, PCNA homolog [Nannocystis exedens]|uniref:Beta sliding clamp n=1 Tax=Nannocystis exedens TaxID=54 RepID=A0A1I2HXT0_9BACT|nr:DNA polymerase III sliding clamp (beta) subunit, PCNA homolog [Nannocystis exedens]
MTEGSPIAGAPKAATSITLDSTRDEVLAALRAADPAAHEHAERGEWDQLEHHGPAAEQALAWARFHRQLPAQRRQAEHLELEAAIHALGLARELEEAYLGQLAAAAESDGDMRAVLVEATAQQRATATAQHQPPLSPALAPVPAGAGSLHFSVERDELHRALMTVKAVLEPDHPDLGKIEIACHGTVILRVGSPGRGERQSFFEIRLLTTRCIRAGEATVSGRALFDALRRFPAGPIELVKAQGHDVVKLRARAVETNLPTVNYVPIDPTLKGMVPAGVIDLDHLRILLDRVRDVASGGTDASVLHNAVRLSHADGRLQAIAMDEHRLVRAVVDLPGGEPLRGFHLHASDVDRLFRIALAFPSQLHPANAGPPLARLSVSAGKVLTVESDALRGAVSHDPRPAAPYASVIPADLPDAVVVSRDKLTDAARAVVQLFGDEPSPRMLLRACPDRLEVAAHRPETGPRHTSTLPIVAAYGRPFALALDARYLLDALSHGPPTVAVTYDGEHRSGPIALLGWPFRDEKVGRQRAQEFFAHELKSGPLALIMSMLLDEEEDHGCAD